MSPRRFLEQLTEEECGRHMRKTREEGSRRREREAVREEVKTVARSMCVNPFSTEAFEDLCGACGGSGGSSVCGPAGLLGVSGVFEVLVSPWLVGDLGLFPFLFRLVNLLCRSPFLSPESVEPSLSKVKEIRVWRVRPKTCSRCPGGGLKKWIAESTIGGLRSGNRLQKKDAELLEPQCITCSHQMSRMSTWCTSWCKQEAKASTIAPGLLSARCKRESGRECGAMGGASKNVHLSGTEVGGAEVKRGTGAAGTKHKLEKLKKESERARMRQGKDLPAAEGAVTVATVAPPFVLGRPLRCMTWISNVHALLEVPFLGRKERDWWSADLEGDMEKLAVEGFIPLAESGPKYPDGKVDHWSTQTVLTKEESEGVRPAVNERQEMEVDEVVPEM